MDKRNTDGPDETNANQGRSGKDRAADKSAVAKIVNSTLIGFAVRAIILLGPFAASGIGYGVWWLVGFEIQNAKRMEAADRRLDMLLEVNLMQNRRLDQHRSDINILRESVITLDIATGIRPSESLLNPPLVGSGSR